MSSWGQNGKFFFPVSRGLMEHAIWTRQPDRDIWLVLMRDAHETGAATVRVSYPTLARRTAFLEGTRRREWSRKQLRAAIERLVAIGSLTGAEGAQRRAQGGAQGYFTVTLANFERYALRGSGSGTGRGTGTGQPWAQLDEIREERKDKSPPFPPRGGLSASLAEEEGAALRRPRVRRRDAGERAVAQLLAAGRALGEGQQ